jgi:Na+-driven multidrug efflux pump
MTLYSRPTRKPTASEYKVLAALFSFVCFVVGSVAVYFSFRVGTKNPQDAAVLWRVGLAFLALGAVAVFGAIWIRRMFSE